ncbi:MAG: hypothetical protein H0X13_19455 [Ramlibacter sp.]|nr:hypothetical protein [Ramlibacter sp.]
MERRLLLFVIAALLAMGTPAQVITQKSRVNGVIVAVTAGNLGPDATVWDFAVVLRGNRKLADDLVSSAVLVDPRGRQYKALVWEGAPSEGSHRAGVLKFIAVEPRPDWIELRIARSGERKPRSFSWLLGNGLVASR